jgi:hypothetical protein
MLKLSIDTGKQEGGKVRPRHKSDRPQETVSLHVSHTSLLPGGLPFKHFGEFYCCNASVLLHAVKDHDDCKSVAVNFHDGVGRRGIHDHLDLDGASHDPRIARPLRDSRMVLDISHRLADSGAARARALDPLAPFHG